MRPVIKGMCSYTDIVNGTLTIYDVALMNQALDVQAENELRAQERAQAEAEQNRGY